MFNFSKKDKKPENVKEVLRYLDNLEKKIEKCANSLENLEKVKNLPIQKMGIVRFNPFSGTGSDQSFSVALLNGENTGVVLTSIFSREGNRVYAKPVEGGESKYSLSEEEKEAIKKAAENNKQ
jgi:hypothetical protein